jgi:fructose-1,6-bisphosphatase/sedoheptulose 1,7-bisphosphatase-like protein
LPNKLRYDVADERLTYDGPAHELRFDSDRLIEFNHRHKNVLDAYDVELHRCSMVTLADKVNYRSNLGALRNRKVRQSVILSAALAAAAVGLHGRGSLRSFPKKSITKDLTNRLKRANDRTAAQVMAEVLQLTTEGLPVGEEVLIESTITEGVRVKPGKEEGGNPTISVGAVFGKDEHRAQYGLPMSPDVTLMSMGNDVIDGTTKSVTGDHSSITSLFLTEAHVKRHLPDIYVQRWMSGAYFEEFNPRQLSLEEVAEIVAGSYGFSGPGRLSAYFLDRPRHQPAMDALNKIGVATPFDKDGDLIPAALLGMEGLVFPDGRGLSSMIGEIGGSAEWAVGVLPLVWRGGQAIGMLTSQSSLTRTDLTPEQKWKERFHYTEEEFMLMQDARFERKPYFTIADIIDDPFAGGVCAYGAIADNIFLPMMKGVRAVKKSGQVRVSTLVINSMGVVELWQMTFRCRRSIGHSLDLMRSPKEFLEELTGAELTRAVGKMLSQKRLRQRFRIFFYNEYYPAIIHVREKMVLLHKAVEALVARGVWDQHDLQILAATERLAPEWFFNSD